MADENQNDMSFWDHLEELRHTLFKIGGVLVVFAIAFFIFMPDIFDNIILAPCKGDFVLYQLFENITKKFPSLPQFSTEGFKVELININLASQFFIHMTTSLWLAVVFAFPFIVWFLWNFIKPALYENERRGSERAFLLGVTMFFLGVAVGYFVVFPITLRFLAEYKVSELVPNQISLNSYMDNFLMLIFIMGIVFEMPLVAWLLSKMGFLHREFFHNYRRHAVVVLLVLAAFITPTGDPFTLCIVFLPLYLLYELSAYFVSPTPKEE
ncbi:MAG: twin-arginine translocase subunit TatC [Muribaculaceae bacterium]|jgi:sec-independent protein translocase protein TatC|nr:twin-arginine translocase subunit TatC [Muribaculaceae bacterium]